MTPVFTAIATVTAPPSTAPPVMTHTPSPAVTVTALPNPTSAVTFEPDVAPVSTSTSTPETPPVIRTERRLYLPIARRAKA
ncbi:MAG: hypothetical protein R2911_06045 [Caldilineaceae bacterium]